MTTVLMIIIVCGSGNGAGCDIDMRPVPAATCIQAQTAIRLSRQNWWRDVFCVGDEQ